MMRISVLAVRLQKCKCRLAEAVGGIHIAQRKFARAEAPGPELLVVFHLLLARVIPRQVEQRRCMESFVIGIVVLCSCSGRKARTWQREHNSLGKEDYARSRDLLARWELEDQKVPTN
jgi:hypothetical protein